MSVVSEWSSKMLEFQPTFREPEVLTAPHTDYWKHTVKYLHFVVLHHFLRVRSDARSATLLHEYCACEATLCTLLRLWQLCDVCRGSCCLQTCYLPGWPVTTSEAFGAFGKQTRKPFTYGFTYSLSKPEAVDFCKILLTEFAPKLPSPLLEAFSRWLWSLGAAAVVVGPVPCGTRGWRWSCSSDQTPETTTVAGQRISGSRWDSQC